VSESVERRPLIDAETAKPVADSAGVPRSERARRTGYRRRFAIVYGGLALIGGIAIGALIVLLTRPDAVPNPAWSNWEPTGSSNARVKQIADHVAKEYRFQGEQMVVALGGPPTVAAGGDSTAPIPISAIAVPKMVQEGEWWGLLILIFPLIGLLMLWSAIRLTWLAITRGRASLQIQNAPVHLGSVVAGHVSARRMSAGDTFRVKLECATGAGTAQYVVHWSKETTARVVQGPQGGRLAFSFQTPDRLPADAGARDENTDWLLHLYRDDAKSPTYSFSFELLPPQGAEHEPRELEEDEDAEAEGEAADPDEPQLAGAAAAPSPAGMQNLARMMGAKSVESMTPTQRARFEARLNSMTPQQREAIAKIGSYAGYLPLVKKLVIGIVVLFVLMQIIGAVTMFLFAR